MDNFFTQTHCDRCHKPLTGGRTMSMFNTQCICWECEKKERQNPAYKDAVKADHEAIRSGNFNFSGIGFREAINEAEFNNEISGSGGEFSGAGASGDYDDDSDNDDDSDDSSGGSDGD